MEKDYSQFKYYNGEKECPFSNTTDPENNGYDLSKGNPWKESYYENAP